MSRPCSDRPFLRGSASLVSPSGFAVSVVALAGLGVCGASVPLLLYPGLTLSAAACYAMLLRLRPVPRPSAQSLRPSFDDLRPAGPGGPSGRGPGTVRPVPVLSGV